MDSLNIFCIRTDEATDWQIASLALPMTELPESSDELFIDSSVGYSFSNSQ